MFLINPLISHPLRLAGRLQGGGLFDDFANPLGRIEVHPTQVKRRTRTRSLGNHPAAPFAWGVAALAVLAGTSAWIGPIDVNGGRAELGKVFVIFLIPILAAAFAFDPVVRLLDRFVYPKDESDPGCDQDAAIAKEDLRQRASRRSAKSQAHRPFSSSRATPWLYAAGVIGVMVFLFQLASLIEFRDGLSLAWVIIVGTSLAAIPAYDPVVSWLDRRSSREE